MDDVIQLHCVAIETLVISEVRWYLDADNARMAYDRKTVEAQYANATLTQFKTEVQGDIYQASVSQFLADRLREQDFTQIRRRVGTDLVHGLSSVNAK